MFELSTLAAKDSVELELKHPVTDEVLADKEGNTVKAVLWGTSSKAYRTAINALQNRQLKRGKKQARPEELREDGVALLTACTQRFDNMSIDGKPLDNEDAITALYRDDRFLWVKTQVDEALGDISLFIKA